jgi:hypothetical protein
MLHASRILVVELTGFVERQACDRRPSSRVRCRTTGPGSPASAGMMIGVLLRMLTALAPEQD